MSTDEKKSEMSSTTSFDSANVSKINVDKEKCGSNSILDNMLIYLTGKKPKK